MSFRAMRGGVRLECGSPEEMLAFLRGGAPANATAPTRAESMALFNEHRELAAMFARLAKRRGCSLDVADLEAFALEGLWDASLRFDPDRGVAFKTFASRRIIGQIADEVRSTKLLTRGALRAGAEIAELHDETTIADPAVPVDEQLHELRMVRAVRERTDALKDRERALVVGHYVEDRRFDHVASDLGISKSWASRIHTKAVGRLRRALKAEQVAL